MEYFQETVMKTLSDGGWLMIPLAFLGLFIYSTILEIIFYLRKVLGNTTDTDQWAHWIESPGEAKGYLGDMLTYVRNESLTTSDVRQRIYELKQAHLSKIDSRLRFSTVLVSTAPLTGLLGTVTGMLATFAGLAVSSGGNTIDLVAGGISEALITTQTGLVLAIPGYVLINIARQKRNQLDIFLNNLEILTIQYFERQNQKKAS